MAKILIVEDDLAFGTMIQTWLRKKGFEVERATSVKSALHFFEDNSHWDLVLSDLRLPDHDGLTLLQWLKKHDYSIPFIVMTSYAEVQNAVLAMKSGATDYVAKPFHPDILLEKIQEALKAGKQAQNDGKSEERAIRHQNSSSAENESASSVSQRTKSQTNHSSVGVSSETSKNQNVLNQDVPKYLEGESEASRKLYDFVSLVAPTPMSVLILGASGTGKEYVAHRIHDLSQRAGKPFFALDCGAIPKDVAASEFFGYTKGAFTGADQDKKGAFEMANGGTLFLDEMGNLNYEVQVQLLRALQERKIRPLGSTKEIDIDIRLVCATNENLAQRVAEGNFREDLYHRVNEFTIYMPELKNRGTDLFLFADLFIKKANKELGRQITLHDEQTELQRIEAAIKAAGGNKSKAAQLLAIDRKTLYNKLKKYGL